MQLYTPFIERIESSFKERSAIPSEAPDRTESDTLLRGETASDALRDLIPIEALRSMGSFFTSSGMAEDLWGDTLLTLDESSVVVDPACGAGDLLIPAVRRLADVGQSNSISSQIRGIDLQTGFVRAAKARLRLSALVNDSTNEANSFEQIEQKDFFQSYKEVLNGATHVVLNPPFITVDAPADCTWGARGINAAALFFDLCLSTVSPGCRIMAILPEVLRSGTRYSRWRSLVESRSETIKITSLGQFDSETDIDVFKIEVTVRIPAQTPDLEVPTHDAWQPALALFSVSKGKIGDYFDVKVGPVVPHRHPDEGAPIPFLTARGLPSWTVVDSIDTTRGFNGRMHEGPFVVLRRTSRPGEIHRARATTIAITGKVAVENHLIVLSPFDNRLDTCIKLMNMLKAKEVTEYLDHRIKCRHLTVGAIRDIAWIEDGEYKDD